MSYGDGYYYGNRKRVTKSEINKRNKTRKSNQQLRLYQHIINLKETNPDRYSTDAIYLTRQHAISKEGDYWWGKCKRGHITERPVSSTGCTVCREITTAMRDKRIKEAILKLTVDEQVELSEIYNKARRLTKTTGVQYHVDHIRPIAAGGSHHPDNLQIITAQENLKKGAEYQGKTRTYSKKEKAETRKIFEEKIGFTRKEAVQTKPKPSRKEKTFFNDGSLFWVLSIVTIVLFLALS